MGPESAAPEATRQVPGTLAPTLPASPDDDVFEVDGLDDEVLLLEEVADPEEDLPDAFADPQGGIDSGSFELGEEAERPGAAPVLLSKFRHSAPSAPPSPSVEAAPPDVGESRPPAKGAALGRLKLVKRRKGGGDGPPKPSAIRRLLSSF
jgi:hypothetical protein